MSPESRFQFVADQLAIDFANTEIIEAGKWTDLLQTFDSLMDWLVRADILDPRARSSIERKLADQELRAVAVKEARRLRKAIAGVIQSAISGTDIPTSSVAEINRALRKGEGYRELVRKPNGFAVSYRSEWSTPGGLLAPLAASAADLLSYGDLSLIKKCENPECILHVYDTTKNHSRRWCSMSACGNRNKVNAYRNRAGLPAKPGRG